MTKILFIANPTSEMIDKTYTESLISDFADKYDFKWELYYTRQNDANTEIHKKIKAYNPDIVVAAGGDGTVNQVAAELVNSKIELGIIPAGSANGLAYNLGIPSDMGEALQFILESNPGPVDLIRLNKNIYCCHLSDIGINARIVKRFEHEGSKGLSGYGKQMLKELLSERNRFKFILKTPSLNKRFSAEMLVIANARCFGTGAVVNPTGKLDDGQFEIVIIRPYSWGSLFHLTRMFLFGKSEKLKYVHLIKTYQAEILLDSSNDLQVDGEIISGIKSLKVEILPSALKVRYK